MLVSFFQARGKMCAAYDPSGAIIVCGGGPRFWRPSNNCWQLVKVFHKFYWHIHETLSILLTASPLYVGFKIVLISLLRVSLTPGLRFLRCTQFTGQPPPSTGASSGCLVAPQVSYIVTHHDLRYNTFCYYQVMTAMTTPSLTRSRPTTPRRKHGVSR